MSITTSIESEALSAVVPESYTDAVVLYGHLSCSPDEWQRRTTTENAAWLIRFLASRVREEKRFSNEMQYLFDNAHEAWDGKERRERERRA